MKRNRFMVRLKILPIAWLVILLGSVYLIIRFAALSFSDDVGQATGGIKEAFMSSLSIKIMESGSSFISYSSNDVEEAYSFPVNLVANEFALYDFIKYNSPMMAMAQENSLSLGNEYLLSKQGNTVIMDQKDKVEEYFEEENKNIEDEAGLTIAQSIRSIENASIVLLIDICIL